MYIYIYIYGGIITENTDQLKKKENKINYIYIGSTVTFMATVILRRKKRQKTTVIPKKERKLQ